MTELRSGSGEQPPLSLDQLVAQLGEMGQGQEQQTFRLALVQTLMNDLRDDPNVNPTVVEDLEWVQSNIEQQPAQQPSFAAESVPEAAPSPRRRLPLRKSLHRQQWRPNPRLRNLHQWMTPKYQRLPQPKNK